MGHPNIDCSSTITITNNLESELKLQQNECEDGEWENAPPSAISAGQTVTIKAIDHFGLYGSMGSFEYGLTAKEDGPKMKFDFHCPLFDDNSASYSIDKVPCLYKVIQNGPSLDGVLEVTFTISYLPETLQTSILSVWIINAAHPLINTKGNTVFGGSRTQIYQRGEPFYDGSCSGIGGCIYPVCIDCEEDIELDLVLEDTPSALNESGLILSAKGEHIQGTTELKTSLGAQNNHITMRFNKKVSGQPWGYAESLQWSLQITETGQQLELYRTQLEVYGIKKDLEPFLSKGIPVNFLRRIVLPASEKYLQELTDSMTKINLAFDTYGIEHYWADIHEGTFFDLWRFSVYLGTGDPVPGGANDFNAALQIARLLHPESSPDRPWAVMNPLGYVKTIDLLGRGKSNNPLYCEDQAIQNTSINDSRRQGFLSHPMFQLNQSEYYVDMSFGILQGLSPADYISTIIDTETLLYSKKHGPSDPKMAGTPDAITKHRGVTSTDMQYMAIFEDSSRIQEAEIFIECASMQGIENRDQVELDFGLFPLRLASLGFKAEEWRNYMSEQFCVTRFSGRMGVASVEGQIIVGNNREATRKALRCRLTTTLLPISHMFRPGSNPSKLSQIHAEATQSIPHGLWVWNNILLELKVSEHTLLGVFTHLIEDMIVEATHNIEEGKKNTGNNIGPKEINERHGLGAVKVNTDSTSEELEKSKVSQAVEDESKKGLYSNIKTLLSKPTLTFSKRTIYVGDRITISLKAGNFDATMIQLNGPKLLLMDHRQTHRSFKLLARYAGKATFRVYYSDRNTHAVSYIDKTVGILRAV